MLSVGAAGSASRGASIVKREEIVRIERYLRRLFGSQAIAVRSRPRKEDSAEVFIGEEFIGILFRDVEEGELSYNFSMAILDIDLES